MRFFLFTLHQWQEARSWVIPCLALNPIDRLDITTLLSHPFFMGVARQVGSAANCVCAYVCFVSTYVCMCVCMRICEEQTLELTRLATTMLRVGTPFLVENYRCVGKHPNYRWIGTNYRWIGKNCRWIGKHPNYRWIEKHPNYRWIGKQPNYRWVGKNYRWIGKQPNYRYIGKNYRWVGKQPACQNYLAQHLKRCVC